MDRRKQKSDCIPNSGNGPASLFCLVFCLLRLWDRILRSGRTIRTFHAFFTQQLTITHIVFGQSLFVDCIHFCCWHFHNCRLQQSLALPLPPSSVSFTHSHHSLNHVFAFHFIISFLFTRTQCHTHTHTQTAYREIRRRCRTDNRAIAKYVWWHLFCSIFLFVFICCCCCCCSSLLSVTICIYALAHTHATIRWVNDLNAHAALVAGAGAR